MKKYKFWDEILTSVGEYNEYSSINYNNHNQNALDDYRFVCNLQLDFQSILNSDLQKKNFFDRSFDNDQEILKYFEDNILKQAEIDVDHEYHDVICKKLALTKKTHIAVNLQEPNGIVGVHSDTYGKFFSKFFGFRCGSVDKKINPEDRIPIPDMKRFILFGSDWHQGQVFMIGKSCLTDWKKGDIYSFPWYMPHSTANASRNDRLLLVITGQQDADA